MAHALAEDRLEAARPRSGRAVPGAPERGRTSVLALQRLAGNRAVTSLLGQPVVQRGCGCGGSCDGCGDKEEEAPTPSGSPRPVQREGEEDLASTGASATTTATPVVEACAGSEADGAGVGVDSPVEVTPPQPGTEGGPLEGTGIDEPAPLAEPAASAGTCKALAWSDFTESDSSGAFTAYSFKQSGSTYSAEFDAAASWRSKKVDSVFTDMVADCQSTDFENFSFALPGTPEATCLATKQPGPETAKKKEECTTKIKPLVDAANSVESARLLRHEQYHMKLGCALAAKANAAIAKGTKITPAQMTAKNKTVSDSYDAKSGSDHSCTQSGQDKWEKDIDAGLPAVTF